MRWTSLWTALLLIVSACSDDAGDGATNPSPGPTDRDATAAADVRHRDTFRRDMGFDPPPPDPGEPPICEPDCTGRECGPDQCGGTCGACADNHLCVEDRVCVCEPQCFQKTCGADGCGGSCWDGFTCPCDDGIAICGPPRNVCFGKECGPDGWGGSCGDCGGDDLCINGQCICTPECEGKACGDDGCGGTCGFCPDGSMCSGDDCSSLESCKEMLDCLLVCSDDLWGCWQSCSLAATPEIAFQTEELLVCLDGACAALDVGCFLTWSNTACASELSSCLGCVPSCGGKTCGPDGCGGSCGTCGPGGVCVETGCVAGQCQTKTVPGCCTDDAQCDDGQVCTSDGCDAVTGACVTAPIAGCCQTNAGCDDGQLCTTDICDVETGACGYTPKPGCCSSDADCEDGLPCTTNTCNTATGACSTTVLPDCCQTDEACIDNDPCTADLCISETGECGFVMLPGCCTTDDDCQDTDACTENVCLGNQCATGVVPDCCTSDAQCDDGDPCTFDLCSVSSQCDHPPKPPIAGAAEICGDGIDNDCDPNTVCYTVVHGGSTVPLSPIEDPAGIASFYGYQFEFNASADTGFEVQDNVAVLLHVDAYGNVSLVFILDEVQAQETSPDGGSYSLAIAGAAGFNILVHDDAPGAGNDEWDYDPVSGTGTIAWAWAPCCTDGLALGYLKGTFCIELTPLAVNGIAETVVWTSPTTTTSFGAKHALPDLWIPVGGAV